MAGKHRVQDGQQSTSEKNGGPNYDTDHKPRHAAQETTKMDVPPRDGSSK